MQAHGIGFDELSLYLSDTSDKFREAITAAVRKVAARAAAAALLGAPSYAHLKAGDGTLARAPEAAEAFLRQLAEVRGEGWCVGGKVVDEGWWGVDVEGCVL